MINKIIRRLNRRQVKIFAAFLLCSVLAWFVSKLSENYTNSAVVDLRFVNAPKDQLLVNASHENIAVKLEGVGFQFLGYSIRNKTFDIDLSAMRQKGDRYYLSKKIYKVQIEKQLKSAAKLIEIEDDTLFFRFEKIIERKLPINPQLQLHFVQDHTLEGEVTLTPDSIVVKGPENEVNSISEIKTALLELQEVSSNFVEKVTIVKPEDLKNLSFSVENIAVEAKVSQFSEKSIAVEITAIHLPKNSSLKMFPNEVEVLCKGSIKALKNLKSTNFQIIVDYRNTNNGVLKKVPIEILKQPLNLQSVVLQKNEIEYILEQE